MLLRALRASALAALLISALPVHAVTETLSGPERMVRLADRRVRYIEDQIDGLKKELLTLPEALVSPLTRSFGFHSRLVPSQDEQQWVQVDLGREQKLDAVALVGAHIFAQGQTRQSYGFPRSFRVEVSSDAEFSSPTLLAEYRDMENPGDLPVFIEAHGATAHFVRVTATQLAKADNAWFFALGELMILSGECNIAATLSPDAVTSSTAINAQGVWDPAYLIDGLSDLGAPIGSEPSPTRGWRTPEGSVDQWAWCQIDLGRAMPLDELRIVPAQTTEGAELSVYGLPRNIDMMLMLESDISKWVRRRSASGERIFNAGSNPIVLGLDRRIARYVRFSFLPPRGRAGQARVAISEVQVYAGGKNVALGIPVTVSSSDNGDGWAETALTDGSSSTRHLVELYGWLRSLSERRDRLDAIATLREEHAQRLRSGAALVECSFLGLLGVTMFGSGMWIWKTRTRRHEELDALRQRIACDLHDEIGSNLGGIAILSRVAADTVRDLPESVRSDFSEIHVIARQTHETMHDLVWLLESDREDKGTLMERFEAAARTLLNGLEWTLHFTGEPVPKRLPVDFRRHLFLAFKETLHNVARHALARTVHATIHCTARHLTLTVVDDGRGFDPASNAKGTGFGSLQHRAARLGGKCTITSKPGAGTTVELAAKLPR